jgi:8-oxo-dGTP pyrophosphatase MutT (NUDIX family)
VSDDPEQLAARYGALATVVRRGGRAYPAAYAVAPALRFAVGSDPLTLDPELAAGGAAHLAAVRERVPWMYDGAILCLDRIDGDVMTLRQGGYWGRVSTCDALRAEPGDALRDRADALAVGDPLHCGTGRAAGLGVTVLAVVRGHVVLGRRAGLPIGEGTWHVVPAGMAEVGVKVGETAVTELREELGLDAAATDLRMLGVGFDLLRLVPEVVYRVDLDADPEAVVAAAPRDEHDAFELHAIAADGTVPTVWEHFEPLELAAPGAAALALLEQYA